MTNSVLRKKVHAYIDQVDDHILGIVYQLLEREVSISEYEISADDKRMIDKRIADFLSGKDKGVPASAVSRSIRNKLKNVRK